MITVSRRTRISIRFGFFAGLLASLVLLAPLPAAAKYAAIVVDADTGKVLHEANADTRNHPASLTKMMTLYMLFDAVQQNRLTMDSRLKVSGRAANMAPSKLGLTPGSTISVQDAIQALVTKSANDAAAVIAENLGNGSESRFSQLMTAKARALGMRRTTFKNASGLPNNSQYSSARDMAILGRRLMTDFPQHYHYFGQDSFTYAGQAIRTHNNLLGNYPGADGLKTGYTLASGFNLAASAKRDGHRVIGVVFGGKTARARDAHMMNLLDNGFARLTGQPETLIAAPMLEDSPADSALSQVAVGDFDETGIPSDKPSKLSKKAAKARQAELASTWGIQLGAYGSSARATEQASLALSRLMTLHPNADIQVQPIRDTKGRTLYRAQVVGLQQADISLACQVADIQTKSGCKAVAPTKPLRTAKR
ncbi:MAG: D-alanyl-D-alanine carboxypeptidase [Rhodospirillaceae bacterium]|nr:D-alanyl-D-alanine carboxypeptidase [Rhodospirillaceae bacterium]